MHVCVFCVCVFFMLFARRSGMLDVVHMWNDEVKTFYEGQIIDQKRIYSQRLVRGTRGSIWTKTFHGLVSGSDRRIRECDVTRQLFSVDVTASGEHCSR